MYLKNIYRFLIISVSYLLISPFLVYSENISFLGAIIEKKSIPTSFWRYGLMGDRLIVVVVKEKTEAYAKGLKSGDIFIDIDSRQIASINDLLQISPGKHVARIFRQKDYLNVELNIPDTKNNTKTVVQKNDEPTVSYNTEKLEKKYGIHEKDKKTKKRSYQQCMEDEMARSDTYEHYLNNPNTGYGYQHNRNALDYKRARKICDEESDAQKIIILNY